jgi:hypothetical protein
MVQRSHTLYGVASGLVAGGGVVVVEEEEEVGCCSSGRKALRTATEAK